MRLVCQCGKNYEVAEQYSGKVIRCRNCGVHLNVPGNELEPGDPGNHATPDAISTTHIPSNPPPSAQDGWAGLTLPAESGHEGPLNSPQVYPPNPGPANPSSPQMPSTDFLPVDTAPPQMTYPPYSAPQGATAYPYGGGPVGPRPKVIDLAAERRKRLEKVSLGVQLVYWSIAILMISGMLVFIFALTPLSSLIPIVHSIGTIGGLVLSLIGYIFCVNAPEETKAQPYIIAVLCIVGAGFLSQFAVIGLAALQAASDSGMRQGLRVLNSMALVSTLLQIAQPIAFLLFLNRIALYVENKVAAREAMTLIIFFAVLIPSVLTILTVSSIIAALLPDVARLVTIIIGAALCFVVSVATLARYMIFLQQFSASFEPRKTRAW